MGKQSTKQKATESKRKKSSLGQDIDLESFRSYAPTKDKVTDIQQLDKKEQKLLENIGVDTNQSGRSGTYLQIDQDNILFDILGTPGLEISSSQDALKKHPWLQEYFWKAVNVATDKYTAQAELKPHHGYFIRAEENYKIKHPVQSCLLLKTPGIQQNVHNIIIAEPNSELHIITGCATPPKLESSLHIGISEFYIKKNAKVTFTMIHQWTKETQVRPRSVAIVEPGGIFITNYVILSPVKSLQLYPTVHLQGEGAKTELYSVVYGSKESEYDVGGRISLDQPGSSGKIVSRAIATEKSKIYARGHLIGKVANTRAHLECNGLLLSEDAHIDAIPQLSALHAGCELSHEATVGKVEAEQLNYLMSRGLTEEEATGLIVRGFMTLRTPDLPDALEKSVKDAIDLTISSGL